MDNLEDLVYNYPTKHQEGFTPGEIKEILSNFQDINMDKFHDALSGITMMSINQESIIFHCDILTALRCGIEDRDIRLQEWD